ncbi:MAG: glucose 1-dehydrogenase [Gammaproteobacteria bacterium]|nr:glucose 1-dehydrogenase [Gammaproteobacteria bacterium]
MARLEGKTALVTGAASGIGEGAVRRFVEEGASVVLADIQEDKGQAIAAELGSVARYVHCDVTSESDIAAAVDLAVAEFGTLDVMVNNAGVLGAIGPMVDTTAEAFDRTMAILSRGVFLGIKHAGRVMVPKKSGSIVSVASSSGVTGGDGPHVYTMAKHGVVGITKSAASEFSAQGVRVNAVAPSGTVSALTSMVVTGTPDSLEMTENALAASSPLGFAPVPADIANAILFLACDESRYVTGHTLVVDAGLTTGKAPSFFHTIEAGLVFEAGRRQ